MKPTLNEFHFEKFGYNPHFQCQGFTVSSKFSWTENRQQQKESGPRIVYLIKIRTLFAMLSKQGRAEQFLF